jgi:hypothetical protein
MSVPVDGGFVRTVAEPGTANGDNLFLRTLTASHLLRMHVGIGGLADGVEDIPLDVDEFVNAIDLEALDG